MKIAVFLDAQGRTAPLWQPGVVAVFTRDDHGWRACQSVPFALSPHMRLAEIRRRTQAMLSALPGCRHFVAQDIHGALLAWLDGMGVTMWRCRGEPSGFLDQLAERIPAPSAPVTLLPEAFILPTEQEGVFRLDLIAALRCGDGAHTSRRLLQPFLQQRPFQRLEVICDHVPKWFDSLPEWGMSAQVETRDDHTLCVVITRQDDKHVR